jgi:hypothetical protein
MAMTNSIVPIDVFKIKPLEYAVAKSAIIFDGQKTDAIVDGLVLDAQYQFWLGFILFTTDDVPYEEMLHITLISEQFRVIDRIDLGCAYHSAILSNILIRNQASIEFSFFGLERWLLTIDKYASFQLNWRHLTCIRYPCGRWRRHYFKLISV